MINYTSLSKVKSPWVSPQSAFTFEKMILYFPPGKLELEGLLPEPVCLSTAPHKPALFYRKAVSDWTSQVAEAQWSGCRGHLYIRSYRCLVFMFHIHIWKVSVSPEAIQPWFTVEINPSASAFIFTTGVASELVFLVCFKSALPTDRSVLSIRGCVWLPGCCLASIHCCAGEAGGERGMHAGALHLLNVAEEPHRLINTFNCRQISSDHCGGIGDAGTGFCRNGANITSSNLFTVGDLHTSRDCDEFHLLYLDIHECTCMLILHAADL